jgi:aspartate aminotransferase
MFQIKDVPEHDKAHSVWKDLKPAESDPVFGLIHFYLKDENPKKILLGVGAYRDDDGKPVILPSVKAAEAKLLEEEKEKEYAFPDGRPIFR